MPTSWANWLLLFEKSEPSVVSEISAASVLGVNLWCVYCTPNFTVFFGPASQVKSCFKFQSLMPDFCFMAKPDEFSLLSVFSVFSSTIVSISTEVLNL